MEAFENAGAYLLNLIVTVWAGILEHPVRSGIIVAVCAVIGALHAVYASKHENGDEE